MTTIPPRKIVPDPLLTREQWIAWQEEQKPDRDKPTKVPYSPHGGRADSSDPDTWAEFGDACRYALENDYDGVGFVFSKTGTVTGVDLDDCRDPDTEAIDDWAKQIIIEMDSYTHISSSGTGLHVFAAGHKPDGGCRRGDVEIYDHGRYFAFTGRRVETIEHDEHSWEISTALEQRTDEIETVWEAHIHREENSDTTGVTASHDLDLEDEKIVEKAKEADYKKDTFVQLYEYGNITGYESQSEADSALCCLLAWWTGHDEQQIDAIFRDSALMRPKWDSVRSSDGETYGELTIDAACSTVTGCYDPDYGSDEDDEDLPEVDPEAFERESTTSVRVITAAMKAATADDMELALAESDRFERMDDQRFLDHETGETVDVIQLVALEEGLIDEPGERVEGRADWVELASQMRWRGATVPRYDRSGGVARRTSQEWSKARRWSL